MPNIDVNLDVRNSPSSGKDGYRNTTASNAAVYSYRYSGGSDGNGNVTETVNAGSGTIAVTLKSDARYQISGVLFSGNASRDLSTQPVANTPTRLIITDLDTSAGTSYYKITVSDTAANCTFDCDPQITNVPP